MMIAYLSFWPSFFSREYQVIIQMPIMLKKTICMGDQLQCWEIRGRFSCEESCGASYGEGMRGRQSRIWTDL
jgi:hypothetical protein